jgi:DNA (cytosine-5)-methyltransferase 1
MDEMAAYYNEIDPYAAQWLRNLIAKGHIAAGEVDERSIEDVRPDDLRGFTQCHFFAGLGGWSIALRLAGWDDDRPVWTGSCPCQPFSQAGKGVGLDDPRHLWPAWKHLIRERRPSKVLGEQVASKDAEYWLDTVQADMEAMGLAFGSIAFPAASCGTPGIRDRTYFVADADSKPRGQGRALNRGRHPRGDAKSRPGPRGRRMPRELADADRERRGGIDALLLGNESGRNSSDFAEAAGRREALELADTDDARSQGRIGVHQRAAELAVGAHGLVDRIETAGPTNGFWRDADWLFCRDGKWRPVEPGTFPLVAGLPAGMGTLSPELRRLAEMAGLDAASLKRAKAYRVGALRGYGNAINPWQAAEFIRAAREAIEQVRTI